MAIAIPQTPAEDCRKSKAGSKVMQGPLRSLFTVLSHGRSPDTARTAHPSSSIVEALVRVFFIEELQREASIRISLDRKEEQEPPHPPESMASWFSRTAGSHSAQLAATAVLSGALVAGTILGFQHVRRQVKVEDLKRSIPDLDEEHTVDQVPAPAPQPSFTPWARVKLTDFGAASPNIGLSDEDERGSALALRARQGDYDDDLILEQLARNRVFLGDEGLAKLRASCIIVVGCGGVGSHAVAALARSGVTRIRVIDFDQVTLSSLNRHSVATLADVGTPKVQCVRRRLEQVTPWVQFDCRNELFSKGVAHRLLEPFSSRKPDYVIDAIDNVDNKVELLAFCHKNDIRVISSMGAGCKSDPTRILIGDISSSIEDPLSRRTRRRLRALGVEKGITVVFSTEKPGPGKAELMPLPDEEYAKGGVNELGVLPDFRVRVLPVLGTMPATFGYTLANRVILEISGYPYEETAGKTREKMYDGILSALQNSEERLAASRGEDVVGLKIPVSRDDVGYLVEEVYRGRSVVTGLSTRLALLRWEAPGDDLVDKRIAGQKMSRLRLRDLVCLTREEAQVHENAVLRGGMRPEEMYDEGVLQTVQQRRSEEERFEQYR
ncbi:MAG: hypothetical protein M1832_000696 [Thelocarpon impressellum]|nr:MAG: hypothetical protein M1832_000696 [Thelocarpon impressellum]